MAGLVICRCKKRLTRKIISGCVITMNSLSIFVGMLVRYITVVSLIVYLLLANLLIMHSIN